MRFLIDRCAGRRLAEWLAAEGHDSPKPARGGPIQATPRCLWAVAENRILITIETNFGAIVHLRGAPHAGLVRLPDAPASTRMALMRQILQDHSEPEFGFIRRDGPRQ